MLTWSGVSKKKKHFVFLFFHENILVYKSANTFNRTVSTRIYFCMGFVSTVSEINVIGVYKICLWNSQEEIHHKIKLENQLGINYEDNEADLHLLCKHNFILK